MKTKQMIRAGCVSLCAVLAACAPEVRVVDRPVSGTPAAERRECRSSSREILAAEGLSGQYRRDPYAALRALSERHARDGGADRLFALAELCGSLGASQLGKSPAAAAGCYLDAARLARPAALKVAGSGRERELLLIYNDACSSLTSLLKEQRQDWSQAARFHGPLRSHRLSLGRPSDGGIDWDVYDELIPADRLVLTHAELKRKRQDGVGGAMVAHMPQREVRGPDREFVSSAGMALPVNAMLEFPGSGDRAELEIRNLLQVDHLRGGGNNVPLAADWSASLVYVYRYAATSKVGFEGMLRPAKFDKATDLYELAPFDPDKIPVILVHGLMSTPETWVDLVNELQSDPVLRKNYQPVLFRYPTGYPLGRNAASLRAKLDTYRALYETPRSRNKMRQMVLIGHSMGGILSSWQIRDSGDEIRKMYLDRPVDELDATPEQREAIRNIVDFEANPDVRRAIFMAAPHRGSQIASTWIGGLGSKLIRVPGTFLKVGLSLTQLEQMDGLTEVGGMQLNARPDSVRNLRPDNPALGAMLRRPVAERVTYHTIAGQVNQRKPITEGTDTLVPYWSSHLEGAASEKIVDAAHTKVTHHPDSIAEVRRLLYLHIGRTLEP